MGERQDTARLRALKGARIVYGNGSMTRGCTIRNPSGGGAKLVLQSATDIPDLFDLFFDDGARRSCVVRWRRLTELGVEFLD